MKNNLHKDYWYSCIKEDEPLILEPDDWSVEEWKTIEKLFGMEEAERIVVSDYTLETYGLPNKRKCEVCGCETYDVKFALETYEDGSVKRLKTVCGPCYVKHHQSE